MANIPRAVEQGFERLGREMATQLEEVLPSLNDETMRNRWEAHKGNSQALDDYVLDLADRARITTQEEAVQLRAAYIQDMEARYG